MIYNQERNIRVVGNIASLDGYQVEVNDILLGASHLWDEYTSEINETMRLLLANDNWGEKETQWEDALYTLDYDFIHMLIEQGKMIMPLIDILSNGWLFEQKLMQDLDSFDDYEQAQKATRARVSSIAHAICNHVLESNKPHYNKEAIFAQLNENPDINIQHFISLFADVNGQAFKSLELLNLELSSHGSNVLERTENIDLLTKYAKIKNPGTQCAVARNPNTPRSILEYLQDNVPESKPSLISVGFNPVKIVKSYIAGAEHLHNPNATFTITSSSIINSFLKWVSENKDTYNGSESIKDTISSIINLPAKKALEADEKFSLANLILCDYEDFTMSILNGELKPERQVSYELACYRAGSFSKHTKVLDFVLSFIKNKYNESDPQLLKTIPANLSRVEECAIGIMSNPYAPQSYKDEVLKLGLKSVEFVMEFLPNLEPNVNPFAAYHEALKIAEQVRIQNNI